MLKAIKQFFTDEEQTDNHKKARSVLEKNKLTNLELKIKLTNSIDTALQEFEKELKKE